MKRLMSNRKRKEVLCTPPVAVSPTRSRIQSRGGNRSPEPELPTHSVLTTLFRCFKLPKTASFRRGADRRDPPKDDLSSSSLSAAPSDAFPKEDMIQLGITAPAPKPRRKNRKKRRRRRKKRKSLSLRLRLLRRSERKCASLNQSMNERAYHLSPEKLDLKRTHRPTGPHNLEFFQSANTSTSSSINEHEKRKEKHPKHKVIHVKAATGDGNVASESTCTKIDQCNLLIRQSPEIQTSFGNLIGESSSPPSFGTERLVLGNKSRERINPPNPDEWDESIFGSSSKDYCWGKVLSEMANHSALTGEAAKVKTAKESSEIDTAWLAAMGGIGAFSGASKSLRTIENETEIKEKSIYTMSYEERKEARSRYILLIEELRDDIGKLQKRQQKVRGNMEEMTNMINRVKWSLPKYKDITSTYAVELKITNLNIKRSTVKEGLYVLESEINQKMAKVKDLSNSIAQLKLLDTEDELLTDSFKDMNPSRVRPLGAHNRRIRSRTENMQRYIPYSYNRQEFMNTNENKRKATVQTLLDDARKHLENCPGNTNRSNVPEFIPEELEDEFLI